MARLAVASPRLERKLKLSRPVEPITPPATSGFRDLSKRRRRLYTGLAAALVLLLALIVTELLLRAFNPLGLKQRASWHFLLWEGLRPSADPECVWEHVPGYQRRLVGYRVKINALGFRGEELAADKPAQTFRLLAVGDSMTFGMSGEQNDCYPAQLRRMLREQTPQRQWEVVNAGVIGYTTLQEEALLRKLLPRLQPDLVVLWWMHNDLNLTGAANPAPQREELIELIGVRPRTAYRHLLHAAYEALPCTMALVRTAVLARHEGDTSYFRFSPEQNPAGWTANRQSLYRIIALCESSRTPLLIYSFGRYAELNEICRTTQTPYATSVEKAGREHLKTYALAVMDQHFNREGNTRVARTILAAIARHKLAPVSIVAGAARAGRSQNDSPGDSAAGSN